MLLLINKNRYLTSTKNSYIINRKELLKIYDYITKLTTLIANENEGFLDVQHNKIHKTIDKLDNYYANLMVECELLTIEKN